MGDEAVRGACQKRQFSDAHTSAAVRLVAGQRGADRACFQRGVRGRADDAADAAGRIRCAREAVKA